MNLTVPSWGQGLLHLNLEGSQPCVLPKPVFWVGEKPTGQLLGSLPMSRCIWQMELKKTRGHLDVES